MSTAIEIQLDGVESLAAELAVLATQLSDGVRICSSTAAALRAALEDDVGWHAATAVTSWARLLDVLRARTAAVSETLVGAVASYRAADTALAGGMRPVFPRAGAVPR